MKTKELTRSQWMTAAYVGFNRQLERNVSQQLVQWRRSPHDYVLVHFSPLCAYNSFAHLAMQKRLAYMAHIPL